MSEIAEQIASTEYHIQNAKELIENRDAALRLSENKDFKKLFLDGFFKTEAARLVQMSSDPALSAEQRADALSMAQATGHTKRYLSMIVQMGVVADRDKKDLEETLEELRAEADGAGE